MRKVSCLLLAAGDSSRMRGENKLMLKVDGKSLIERTLAEIEKINFEEIAVVTGHQSDVIENELRNHKVQFVHNENHQTGMHSSIKSGLKGLGKKFDAFFVVLGDLPYFHQDILRILLNSYLETGDKKIFVPVFEGKRGHPVLISSDFLPEILNEPDGDYGLSYLLKRHPEEVQSVDVSSRGILLDVDSPEDYRKLVTNEFDSLDPVQEFHLFAAKLREERKPYVMATVIEVIGSASARSGSKAIFNPEGRNLLGWVGGGCAERFIGEECVQALGDHKTRIVLADLDDEIFGLGVACGGKMRVFLEPVYPSETIPLPYSEKFQNEVRILSGHYGLQVTKNFTDNAPDSIEELFILFAEALAKSRGRSGQPLREVKEVPAHFLHKKSPLIKEVTIVGRTRITEALARHFSLLSYQVRAIGPDLKAEDYPSNVKCHCLTESYSDISFKENEIVVIASHASQDPGIVKRAILDKAGHVAMIGSYKRSIETLNYLGLFEKNVSAPLYIPAGLDIDARNPDEIALSVVSEIFLRLRNI